MVCTQCVLFTYILQQQANLYGFVRFHHWLLLIVIRQSSTCSLSGYLSTYHYLNCFHLPDFYSYPAASLLAHSAAPAVRIIETLVVFARLRTNFVSDYGSSIKANFLCLSRWEPFVLTLAVAGFSLMHYSGIPQHWHYIHQCIKLCSAGLIFRGTIGNWGQFNAIWFQAPK